MSHLQSRTIRMLNLMAVTLLIASSGCSSLGSFQGINAIPVHRLPQHVFGRPKSDLIDLSMSRLRQSPVENYLLAPKDVLGVYIENVLGEADKAPPVHFPEDANQPPAIGFPIPVRQDGTLALPLVDPIQVEGMSLEEATEAIREAYTINRDILKAGQEKIIVTLMRRRQVRVLVIREESRADGGGIGTSKKGAGFNVDLPAYENDLLHALNKTGGLPGDDAENEVYIIRGSQKSSVEYDGLVAQLMEGKHPCQCQPHLPDHPGIVRIPMRFYPENPPMFVEDDIVLNSGDIVLIRSRDREKYYTGGAIRGGEHLLPRDYDLDILQAIARAGGSLSGSGSGLSQIGGGGGGGGFGGGGGGMAGGIAPSKAIVLRRTPDGCQIPIRVNLHDALQNPSQRILIQPEDVIIVQYTCLEELFNTATRLIQFNYFLNRLN